MSRIKGTHERNSYLLEWVVGLEAEFVVDEEYKAVAERKAWPDNIHSLEYSQTILKGESTFAAGMRLIKTGKNFTTYHTVKYVIIPYVETKESAEKCAAICNAEGVRRILFVAYEYTLGGLVDVIKTSIKPYELMTGDTVMHDTDNDPNPVGAGWNFGISPMWTFSNPMLDWDTQVLDDSPPTKKVKVNPYANPQKRLAIFQQMYLVYKPIGQQIFQKRFQPVVYQAKAEYMERVSPVFTMLNSFAKDIVERAKEYAAGKGKEETLFFDNYVQTAKDMCTKMKDCYDEYHPKFKTSEGGKLLQTAVKLLTDVVKKGGKKPKVDYYKTEFGKIYSKINSALLATTSEDLLKLLPKPDVLEIMHCNQNFLRIVSPDSANTLFKGLHLLLDGVPMGNKLVDASKLTFDMTVGDYLRPMSKRENFEPANAAAKLYSIDLVGTNNDFNPNTHYWC